MSKHCVLVSLLILLVIFSYCEVLGENHEQLEEMVDFIQNLNKDIKKIHKDPSKEQNEAASEMIVDYAKQLTKAEKLLDDVVDEYPKDESLEEISRRFAETTREFRKTWSDILDDSEEEPVKRIAVKHKRKNKRRD